MSTAFKAFLKREGSLVWNQSRTAVSRAAVKQITPFVISGLSFTKEAAIRQTTMAISINVGL